MQGPEMDTQSQHPDPAGVEPVRGGIDLVQQDEVLARIGQMTRNLHDSLRGLGIDKLIEETVHDIPNVRDRLEYVARMTEKAAQRVLDALDAVQPLQDKIGAGATELSSNWKRTLNAPFSEAESRSLAERTIGYLDDTRGSTDITRQQLLEIMMAQDFQDLTGQVIKKITELAHGLEKQLLQLLIDYAPAEVRREADTGLLNGPQINPDGVANVVASQEQVDDLLDSLGF
jgi:chemotaxis protein CheZ